MAIRKVFLVLSLSLYSLSPMNFTDDEIQIVEKEYGQSGRYPITLYAEDSDGNQIDKTIYVTIKHPNTNIDQKSGEAIDATDFKTTYGVIEKSTSAELVKMAKAHAWDNNTGEILAIDSVEVTKLKEHEFKICFSTKKGTTSCVTALEFESELLPSDLISLRIKDNFHYKTGTITYLLLLISIVPLIVGFFLLRALNSRIDDTYEFIYRSNEDKDTK